MQFFQRQGETWWVLLGGWKVGEEEGGGTRRGDRYEKQGI